MQRFLVIILIHYDGQAGSGSLQRSQVQISISRVRWCTTNNHLQKQLNTSKWCTILCTTYNYRIKYFPKRANKCTWWRVSSGCFANDAVSMFHIPIFRSLNQSLLQRARALSLAVPISRSVFPNICRQLPGSFTPNGFYNTCKKRFKNK